MILEELQKLVVEHKEYAAFYLILAKIVGAVLLFPGTPLTLLAGATFGVVWGTVVSLIGNILGASLAFLLSRYLLRDLVSKTLYKKYPKIQDYEARFFKNGLLTIVFLRLIPLFPFNALNYLLGVTRVTFREYVIGTAVGIIPGTIAFVYFGDSLRMLSPYHILMSILAIAGLIFVGKLYEKKYR